MIARVLLPLLGFLFLAGPAAADPITATLVAIGGTMFGGATVGSIAANLMAGAAVSALSRALGADMTPSHDKGSIKTDSTTAGGTIAQSIIFGRYATGGVLLVPPYSHGWKGDGGEIEHLVMPIAVADYPIDAIESVIIDGELCDFTVPSARNGGLFGNTCSTYNDRAFLRAHDGRQTTADSMLSSVYDTHPDRPWASTAVLKGVAYGVLTYKYDPEIWTGIPDARFIVRGARLYDPRKDTSAGGSGAQRWTDPATWTWTENPVVMIYNLLRGLSLADGTVYGLSVPASRLPLSTWSAAMTACDDTVSVSGGGTRPRYRAGLEFSVDQEPLAVIEEIGRACGADLVELAGEWRIAVGAPAVVSAYLTDDDIIITSPEEFEPFPALSETINAIHASFPSPARLWETTEASPLYNTAWEAEDGGRRLVADLDFSTVPYGHQVRALMRELARDNRRMRVHRLTLPPAYLSLVPLKTIAWTSSHNGYDGKLFEITHKTIDPLTLCSTLTLRERDPADYSPDMIGDAVLPVNPSIVVDNRIRTGVPAFGFIGTSTKDASGAARRPALRIEWSPDLPAKGLAYEIRTKTSGAELASGTVSDVVRGNILISAGVLANTQYEARVKAVGGRRAAWSAWLTATTPDLRIGQSDLAESINTSITLAQEAANRALQDAADASDAADAAMGRANTGVALAQEASDVDAVLAREMSGGWVVNPTFRAWTAGGNPQNWGVEGATYITKNSGGWLYNTAARLAAPGGVNVYVAARHGAGGQLNAQAALKTEWIVVSAIVEYVSGDLASGYLQHQWRTAAGSYVAGTLPLSPGSRLDQILRAEVGTRQAVQLLFRRPASVSEANTSDMRVTLWAGQTSRPNALAVVVHALDCRAATEQEIAQAGVGGQIDAKITAYDTTLQGLLGAGAWSSKSVAARFADAEGEIDTLDAVVVSGANALATRMNTVEAKVAGTAAGKIQDLDAIVISGPNALAARMTTVEARANDGNLALNPTGSRTAADKPADFLTWPAHWSAVAKGGDGSAALNSCPAPYAIKMTANADGGYAAILAGLNPLVAVKPGDRFLVSFDWATGGSGGGPSLIQLRAVWYDRDSNNIATNATGPSEETTSATWQTATRELTAPANAAGVRFMLYRGAGGAGAGYATNLNVARIDKALAGRLDAIVALKASAGNPALLELVSTATGELLSSTARIKADNILLDGSVAARHLVVGDFANLVPDDQLQDLGSWTQSAGSWTNIPTSGLSAAASIGEMRTPNSGTNSLLLSESFPAEPGEVYAFSFQCRRAGGTKMSAALRVYWYENDGTFVSSSNAAEYSGTSATTITRSGTMTAPSTASYARVGFLVVAADTDSTVRFLAPKSRRQVNAVEIRDGAITASHITTGAIVADHVAAGAITAGKIAAEAITVGKIADGAITEGKLGSGAVSSGKIASGAVSGSKLADGAVSQTKITDSSITTAKIVAQAVETDRIKVGAVGRTFVGNSFASTSLTSTDTTLLSWTMPTAVPEGSALQIVFSLGYDTNNGPNTTFKVKKNGVVQFENSTNNNGADTDRTMAYSTVITVGAGDVVSITGTKGSGSATMQFIRASLLVVMR